MRAHPPRFSFMGISRATNVGIAVHPERKHVLPRAICAWSHFRFISMRCIQADYAPKPIASMGKGDSTSAAMRPVRIDIQDFSRKEIYPSDIPHLVHIDRQILCRKAIYPSVIPHLVYINRQVSCRKAISPSAIPYLVRIDRQVSCCKAIYKALPALNPTHPAKARTCPRTRA